MEDQLLQAWEIHDRVNLFVLRAIPPENFVDKQASGGCSVGDQFSHIHNVRLMWLKASIPAALANVEKLEKGEFTGVDLASALQASGRAISTLIDQAIKSGGKVKGFKPNVTAFTCYLISHEAHHRSQAIMALKDSKHPLDKKTLFGMWEWGVR